MKHFLLIYDVEKGELREPPREFARSDRAVRAYEALEREHLRDESVQIVLLGARSLEAIKVTHANFFKRDSLELEEIHPYFAPA
jgi:hypothetical protein